MLCLPETLFPFQATPRRHSLAALLGAVATLGACGGGGSGGSAPEPPPSPPPTAPIEAQMSVSVPLGYDADRRAAFDRLNEIRLSAGLGMLAQNALLDRAAQAHADWIIANDSFTHEETAGSIGFTGARWWDRDEALGYVPLGGEEVMIGPVRGAQGVDALVNTVYHRAGMLAFEPVDVGIGWSGGAAADISMPLVIDMTRPWDDPIRSLGQAAQPSIRGVAIWPLDGARGVPLRLGLESPNPVPGQDVLTLGTPASVGVNRFSTISVDAFSMSVASTGAPVSTSTLTNQSDPNLLTSGSFAALIPLTPLAPNTTYRVDFTGSAATVPSGLQEPVRRAWSFTTGDR